ncbi:MAG: HEAT repeat domain-containing protein [Planctomycetes bacterium]|nr:HEAT repeat domain-containing protein [Planctomycetota bacterium]
MSAIRINQLGKVTLVIVSLSLLAPCFPTGNQSPNANHSIALNGHTFTLPAGFVIELAAGPPLVERPITADFDEQGRLYVSDSSGSNDKLDIQLAKKPHRIIRLEDTKGDGKFDKSVVFADQMMFPEGTMWYDGSLYVAAPPSIWKLTDTKGMGIADKREEWFNGKTLTRCGNDLHGPYLGPDGWIYWCKGAFDKQEYDLSSARPGGAKRHFATRASHVFRCCPDGSGLEPVMTGGMDNPVDLVFTRGGERIITTTFLQFAAGGKRDGLLHIVYGGIYGKDYDPIYEHQWTGPSVMPVLSHLGPAAPAGLHRYESEAFGPKYKDNIFACLFNLQKITRHVLTPDGATFKSRDEDFVVSDNKDFHPTDVIEDADGSLLFVDTGGWYRICCPSSQLTKPDVKGAIYRVRCKDAKPADDPRGLKIKWVGLTLRQLADLLDDSRPVVRRRAVEAISKRGPEAVDLLGNWQAPSPEARRNAVWALARIDSAKAHAALRAALRDSDNTVRQAALHALALRPDPADVAELMRILECPSLHNRRAAAVALGRIGDKRAVPAIFAALAQTNDRFLEHSLTYALIEIGDAERTSFGLLESNPSVRRAALIALDQMEHGKLPSGAAISELSSRDQALRETAWWIASRHSEWGAALSGFLRTRLSEVKWTAADREEFVQTLARLARSAAIQDLLSEQVRDDNTPVPTRRLAMQAMARSDLRTAPSPWFSGLCKALTAEDVELIREAAATARVLSWPKKRPDDLVALLQKVGAEKKSPADVGLLALAALPDGITTPDPELFAFLKHEIDADKPASTRGLAAEVISRAHFDRTQLLDLAQALAKVGPMEIDRVLDAFAQSTDEEVGQKLVTALKSAPARTSLRPDALKSRLVKYSAAVRNHAEAFVDSLHADAAKERAHFEDLLAKLPAGDVRRGQAVFNHPKAACVTCHAIGYVGGKLGPDLTRIGSIRTERDLLESIVYPNASFVRGYEPVVIVTKSGKNHNGLVRKDSPEEVVLALNADQEMRIPRPDIEEMQPSRVSVMPSGLEQQLTLQQLADLVAFLKASR